MADPGSRFLLSVEHELMCFVQAGPRPAALRRLLDLMATYAPSLPDVGRGFFNAYGRVYVDVNDHPELAALECSDPYELALLVEAQVGLLARAVRELAADGLVLSLHANNHDGVLHPQAHTWGTHENYLLTRPAATLGAAMLPFLATRIYAGSGGVLFPSGERLAATRPLFMTHDAGGGTTAARAVFSTAREEHHTPGKRSYHRCHLLVGDGHRSQFNLALQHGATALVLRALEADPSVPAAVAAACARLGLPLGGSWAETLRTCCRLAGPGEAVRVHGIVLEIQALYLGLARAWADRRRDAPPWVARCLQDWADTLAAMQRGDEPWLARRLDAFAKLRLFDSVLTHMGGSWATLPGDAQRLRALTLIDHSYHAITDPTSVFDTMVGSGLIEHRVGAPMAAGTETERWVPPVATRARARARFLAAHGGMPGLRVDWGGVYEPTTGRWRLLGDPFALEFDSWSADQRITPRAEPVAAEDLPF